MIEQRLGCSRTRKQRKPPNAPKTNAQQLSECRQYLYDGKTFTLLAKRLNYYATVPAPATVGRLAEKLDEDSGINVPLADFFRWGTPDWSVTHLVRVRAVRRAARAPVRHARTDG
jgi:hypothetical protein